MIPAILKRRSIREFKSDQIPKDNILEIIKAAQFAPSAKNNKSWEFFVIKNQEIKNKLQELLGQDFIARAPIIIIPAIDPNISVEPVADLSLVTENIFLQAADLNLGTVWKNVRSEFETEVKKIAGIPDNLKIINLIPLGVTNEEKPAHSDSDFDKSKIHWQ
jgi:nitroreductase